MISIYLSMKYPWISRIAVTIILEMIAACALPMISAFAPPLHLPLEKCLVSVPHEGLRQQHHRCCTAVAVSLRASHGGGVEANEAGPMGWTMHQSMGRRNAGSMILSGALIFGLGGSAMSAELDQEVSIFLRQTVVAQFISTLDSVYFRSHFIVHGLGSRLAGFGV